ncbi:MAG: 5'-methylthioadenosine/S-adenosylhomocysteine nucleosidase [Chloroflexota bacterium]
MNIVIIISAHAEWDSVKNLFPNVKIEQYLYGECFKTIINALPITFFHTGWGKTASAGALQHILDKYNPDLIINLGTCGGFAGVIDQGDLILVERTFMYDIVELMDTADVTDYYASFLDLGWLAEPYPFPTRRGLIASADSDLPPSKIPFLKSHGALAADWESAALAWVAKKNNTHLLILRVVSDLVSEEGGEAYGDIEIFKQRTEAIMKQLVGQLPEWLKVIQR